MCVLSEVLGANREPRPDNIQTEEKEGGESRPDWRHDTLEKTIAGKFCRY